MGEHYYLPTLQQKTLQASHKHRYAKGQAKTGALIASATALLMSVVFLSGPSLGEDKSLLNTQTGDKFGLDAPKELDARFGGSGSPSQKSENQEIKNFVRGEADKRARNYALRLAVDSLRREGQKRFGTNFSLQSSLSWTKGTPVRGKVSAVVPLAEGQEKWGSFLQPAINLWTDDLQINRTDLSLGYVARRRTENFGTIGGSVFLDRSDYGHQRASLGAEWRGGPTFFSANLHQPISGIQRGPNQRYEQVLGGWNSELRRSIGNRLTISLKASQWREPANSDNSKTIGGISLGQSQSANIGFQAHPALRLYGNYEHSRAPRAKATDSYKLGFEYRLTGVRPRLHAGADEAEGGIYEPVSGHPAIAVGLVTLGTLAAIAANDDKEDDKNTDNTGSGSLGCPQNPSACPQVAAIVQVRQRDGQQVSSGLIARPQREDNADPADPPPPPTYITVTATLPSVPSAHAYRVEFEGSAVHATDYHLHALYVTQYNSNGQQTRTRMTNPPDHFMVKASSQETILEAELEIPYVETADASEIVMKMIPVALTDGGVTASLVIIETDRTTGIITARIGLAPSGEGEVGAFAIDFALSVQEEKTRNGTTQRPTNTNNTTNLVGEGNSENASDLVSATLEIRAEYKNLGDDNRIGGIDNPDTTQAQNADKAESFPAETGKMQALLHFNHAAGATEDSYQVVLGTNGTELRKTEPNLYQVTLEPFTDDNGIESRQALIQITAKNVRLDAEKVNVTVDPTPVEITDERGIKERVNIFPKGNTKVALTLKAAHQDIIGQVSFAALPENIIEEPETGQVDIAVPVKVVFSEPLPTAQNFTIPLGVKNLPAQRGIATENTDFQIDQSAFSVTLDPSDNSDGDNDASTYTANLNIQVLADGLDPAEPEESFFLVLGALVGNDDYHLAAVDPYEVELRIAANAPEGVKPNVFQSIQALNPYVTEPSQTTELAQIPIQVRVQMDDLGDGAETVIVPIQFSSGSNKADIVNDFVVESAEFHQIKVLSDVSAGRPEDDKPDTATLTLKVKADDFAEGREYITITVLPSDDYEFSDTAKLIATATIVDVDLPFFRLSAPKGLKENRANPAENIIRISVHESNDDDAKSLKLQRPLTFIVGTPNLKDFNVNGRINLNAEFPKRVTISAEESQADFPIHIINNEEVDGLEQTFSLKTARVPFPNGGFGFLAFQPNRGWLPIEKGAQFTIADDDTAKLQLLARNPDGSNGDELSGTPINFTETGSTIHNYWLTVNQSFDGASTTEAKKPQVQITATGLGDSNNNETSIKVYGHDGSTGFNTLLTTLDKNTSAADLLIPLTSSTSNQKSDNDKLLISIVEGEENYEDAANPIVLKIAFKDSVDGTLFDKSQESEISQNFNYISNDLSMTIVDIDNLSLTEGESTEVTVALVKEGVTQNDGEPNPVPFIIFWADATATSGTAKNALAATDYKSLNNTHLTAQPDYPNAAASYGFVKSAIPANTGSATVQLPVLGNKAFNGLPNVTLRLVSDDGVVAEKENLSITNAEGAKISWQTNAATAAGTENTAETLTAKIELTSPDLDNAGETVIHTGVAPTRSTALAAPITITAVTAGENVNKRAAPSLYTAPTTIQFAADSTTTATGTFNYNDDFIHRNTTKSVFNLSFKAIDNSNLTELGNGQITVDTTPLKQEWINDDTVTPTLSFVSGTDKQIVEADQEDNTAQADGSLTFDLGLGDKQILAEPYVFYVAQPAGAKPIQAQKTDGTADQRLVRQFFTFAEGTSKDNDSVQFLTGLSASTKDGALTKVSLTVNPRASERDTTNIAFTGVKVASTGITKPFELLDADKNRIQVEFAEVTGSWSGTETAFTTDDKKTLYEVQTSTNLARAVKMKLVRPLAVGDADVRAIVSLENLEETRSPQTSTLTISKTKNGTYDTTDKTFTFTHGSGNQKDQFTFYVKMKEAANDSAAEGFLTAPIKVTPQNLGARTDFSAKAETIKHIRLDDNNTIGINSDTALEATEGQTNFVVPTSNDGAAVTNPAGSFYKVDLGVADGTRYPIALEAEYTAVQDVNFATLSPGINLSGLLTLPDDEFINGDRYISLTELKLNTTHRGVVGKSVTGDNAQTPVVVKIQDNDTGKIAPSLTTSYPATQSGGDATERSRIKLSANPITEGNTEHSFYIVLDTAHRTNTIDDSDTAPLKIQFAPTTAPSDFTGADYEITLAQTTAGVSLQYDETGNGATTINVKRQGTENESSVKIIPLKLTLKEDAVDETGGKVDFQITELGYLECDTLKQPATTSTTDIGCYNAGATDSENEQFRLGLELADESGALQVSALGDSDNNNEITIAEGDEFTISFVRQPENSLDATSAGYTVNLSDYISIENASAGLTTTDFTAELKRSATNSSGTTTSEALTGVSIANLKGFGTKTSASTGLNLVFSKGANPANDRAETAGLVFATKNDNFVEEDESFVLVIDKTPTPIKVNKKIFKITEQTKIKVTITSEDTMRVSAINTKPIVEGDADTANTDTQFSAGKHTLSFAGAQFEVQQKLALTFAKKVDDKNRQVLTLGTDVTLDRSAGMTSTGVGFEGGNKLVLPADVDDVKVVFNVGLGTEINDDGKTSVAMTLAKPSAVTTVNDGLEEVSGNLVSNLPLADADITLYEVKFLADSTETTSAQENGANALPFVVFLHAEGGLPAPNSQDWNPTTSGNQPLKFKLTLENAAGNAVNGFDDVDSTYTNNRYQWSGSLSGNNRAQANRVFTAKVQTENNVSTLIDGITHDEVTAQFTLYDDDNEVSFADAIVSPYATGTEAEISELPQDYFKIGATADAAINYKITYQIANPDSPADPLEDGEFSLRNNAGNYINARSGEIALVNGEIPTADTPFMFNNSADDIIENTESVKIVLTGITPANKGLQLPANAADRERVLTFTDATESGNAILSLNATPPTGAFDTATADKTKEGVSEGESISLYVHLDKPSEQAQTFKIQSSPNDRKSEFSYDGEPVGTKTKEITLPASADGKKQVSTVVRFSIDEKAEAPKDTEFRLVDADDTRFVNKASSSSVKLTQADETGKIVILDTPAYEIREGTNTLTVKLRRNGALGNSSDATTPANNAALVANVGFAYANPDADKTAASASDYTQDTAVRKVTFTQSGTSNQFQDATVTLTLNAKATDGVEGDEYFNLKLTSATRLSENSDDTAHSLHKVRLDNTNTVSVKIEDTDAPSTLSFASDAVSFTEGQSNTSVTLQVGASVRLNETTLDLEVGAADDGTQATQGNDYTATNNKIRVTIPASVNAATAVEVTVPIVLTDDTVPETPIEKFKISLPTQLPKGFEIKSGGNSTITVSIEDDDNKVNFPTPSGSAVAATVETSEDQGTGDADSEIVGKQIKIPLTANFALSSPVAIVYEVVPDADTAILQQLGIGTPDKPLATLNTDFTLVSVDERSNPSVVLAANQKNTELVITINDNTAYEPTEYFALRLKSASGLNLGTHELVIVKIADDDQAQLIVSTPKAVVERGAQDSDGAEITDRAGEIAFRLNAALLKNYVIEVVPTSNKFTITPSTVTFTAGATALQKVAVTTNSNDTLPADARFTVTEKTSNTHNAVVDLVADNFSGTPDAAEKTSRQATSRQFAMAYKDGDVYTPQITAISSTTGVSVSPTAGGTRLVIPEAFIPTDGSFSLTLSVPELTGDPDATTSSTQTKFVDELAKGGANGGQVNYEIIINDVSSTVTTNRLTTGTGDSAILKSVASGLFKNLTQNGDEVFGFWQNRNRKGKLGFVSDASTLQIVMPNTPFWRNNNTIDGDRSFTVKLKAQAYKRNNQLNKNDAIEAVGANLAEETTWTFVITDDDVNPSGVTDRAQVGFQHYTLFEPSTTARTSFAEVPQSGSWVDGLPARIEKGKRLWLRLSSTKAFSQHLTTANATESERLSFRVSPATGTGENKKSFLESAQSSIYMGYARDPFDLQSGEPNTTKSVPFSVDVKLSEDASGNTLITKDLSGHATLAFASASELASKVPLTSATAQVGAITFKQPASDSVVLYDPSNVAFHPTLTTHVPVPEDPDEPVGKSSLLALKRGTTLGYDAKATITFNTSEGDLRVTPPTVGTGEGNLSPDKITITNPEARKYIVTFKKGLAVPKSGTIPAEAKPTFTLSFASDPDNERGSPTVTATVKVGDAENAFSIPVANNERPIFGFIPRGKQVFESDLEKIFPQFSVGEQATASDNRIQVGLTLEVTQGITSGQGVAGFHKILADGGWTAEALSNGRIPYTKDVTIAGGTTGNLNTETDLGIALANDATISPNGKYEVVFKAPVIKSGNQPDDTNLSEDITLTIFDDDRLYSFLNPITNNTPGDGAWGEALDTSAGDATPANPVLKTEIAGLLQIAAPTSGNWESDANGKIYGYLEGVTHTVDLYLKGGGVADGTNFKASEILSDTTLWQSETRPEGKFGSGAKAACDVFTETDSPLTKATNAFGAQVRDDNNTPSDHLPHRIVGKKNNAHFTMTCGGKAYQVRPATGQPKVVYRFNDDAQFRYVFTLGGTSKQIPASGNNERTLLYTARAGDDENTVTGEGPFYKVEAKLAKPVGYPIAVGFAGQGAPASQSENASKNLAGGFVAANFDLLWIRSPTLPTSELVSAGSSIRKTALSTVVRQYTSFQDTPFYFPAGAVEQSATSRDAAKSSNSNFTGDLYLVVARPNVASLKPFGTPKVLPSRADNRTAADQFTTDTKQGSGPQVTVKTDIPVVENIAVSWSTETATLLQDRKPFLEKSAAEGNNIRFKMAFSGLPAKAADGQTNRAFSFCIRVNNSKELAIDTTNSEIKGFFYTAGLVDAAQNSEMKAREKTQAKKCISANGVWWSINAVTRNGTTVTEMNPADADHKKAMLVFKLVDDAIANSTSQWGTASPFEVRHDTGSSVANLLVQYPGKSWLEFASNAQWVGKEVRVSIAPFTADGVLLTGLGLTPPSETIPVLEDDIIVRMKSAIPGGPVLTRNALNAGRTNSGQTAISQAEWNASRYKGLHGVVEKTGRIYLDELLEIANYVAKGRQCQQRRVKCL